MHILFLTDNFPPEGNAPASRTYEHAVRWVRAGHRVTVITGAPNFPEGVLFPGYRNRWYGVEDLDGIRVVRVKTYITANEGFARRTLDYLSFMVSGFLAGLVQRRPDLIVGTSPQFFTVCAAWVLALFRRRPWVFELRDLWPASIKAVGAMPDGRLMRALESLELTLYRRADAIVTVTETFRAELIGRGVLGREDPHRSSTASISSRYAPRPRTRRWPSHWGSTGRFVVGYIGTHGSGPRAGPGARGRGAAARAARDRLPVRRQRGATRRADRPGRRPGTHQRAFRGAPAEGGDAGLLGLVRLCPGASQGRSAVPLGDPVEDLRGDGHGPAGGARPARGGGRAAGARCRGRRLHPPRGPRGPGPGRCESLAADPARVARLAAASRAAAVTYSRDELAARMLSVLVATAGSAAVRRRRR